MQILIVAATYLEIKNLISDFKFTKVNEKLYNKHLKNSSIDILITGIGIAFTVYALTKALNSKKYDFVLNIGIAGSLSSSLNIGELVQVESEEFADLGIRSENTFSTLFEMNFIEKNEFPFSDEKLRNSDYKNNWFSDIKKVSSITVNTVNGNQQEIEKLKQKFNADIESMEGAAVFYVCLMEKVPFAEIRAISNYVEERNKANWNITLAINNLIYYCKNLLNKI